MAIDSSRLKRIHFVGIKGVAMTALAIYCKEKGIVVTGSDVEEEFPTKESLEKAGIVPLSGFSKEHILSFEKPDLVIFTGAHGGKDNIEVGVARDMGIEVMPHGRALGYFMDGSVQISVAGSHGKTTTTAMIATILSGAGRDPSYTVGCGDVRDLGLPGHFGKGSEFVSEADEYSTDPTHDSTPRFLWQHPDVMVVTNIDYDHPDAYSNLEEVQAAFLLLQNQQKGVRVTVVNADDEKSTVLFNQTNSTVVSYGFSEKADYRPHNVRMKEGETSFSCQLRGTDIGSFSLSIPGRFNIANACGAIAATHALNVPWEDIRKGLQAFQGTKRRFEFIGKGDGIKVYDDYAHHPHEIEATLEGVRGWYPTSRIITIFQPHTFSRTKALLTEFSVCFKNSDIILIPDIYASAREYEDLGMTSEVLVEAIAQHQKDVFSVKDLSGTLSYLKTNRQDGDIILCMGAGDIYGWGRKIITMIQSDPCLPAGRNPTNQTNQTNQTNEL